jgi:hypothetical protein
MREKHMIANLDAVGKLHTHAGTHMQVAPAGFETQSH